MSQKNEQKPPSWLIVEDDRMLRLALLEMLDMWNKTAMSYSDGNQADAWLDEVEAGNFARPIPELALLDIRLPPGPQGDDIAQRLRSLPQTANMAIVMITAYRFSPEERADIERKAQPDLLIIKPFPGLDELKAALDETLVRVQMKMGQQNKSQ